MIAWEWLDARPLLVVLAGPNGAGKSTFFRAHIREAGLPLVNADQIAKQLDLAPYDAARAATFIREGLVQERESFAFETVFSDPVGDKLAFMRRVSDSGYTVVLCFVGLASAKLSAERVAMRVSQGGHDVPAGKIKNRYPRSLANLKSAMASLDHVLVFDNSQLDHPYQRLAINKQGTAVAMHQALPVWFQKVIAK